MEKELIDIGLSEKEAKLFLICLKTGETTANRISELANLPRSTAYDILQKLKNQGLISTTIKQGKTHFIANNPEVLLKLQEEKKRKINRILPYLKEIQNKIYKKPTAEVFEGKKGVIFILDDILNSAKSIKLIGNRKNALEVIQHHPDNFIAKRIEKKIFIQQILEESPEARKLKHVGFSKVKYLKSIKNSKTVVFIYRDTTVNLILGQEISAIRIRSEEYTQSQELLFNDLWKIAKK